MTTIHSRFLSERSETKDAQGPVSSTPQGVSHD